MGIARRRFVEIAVQSAAVLALSAVKLAARVVPSVRTIRTRSCPIPVKRLNPNDVRTPGRWGG